MATTTQPYLIYENNCAILLKREGVKLIIFRFKIQTRYKDVASVASGYS